MKNGARFGHSIQEKKTNITLIDGCVKTIANKWRIKIVFLDYFDTWRLVTARYFFSKVPSKLRRWSNITIFGKKFYSEMFLSYLTEKTKLIEQTKITINVQKK